MVGTGLLGEIVSSIYSCGEATAVQCVSNVVMWGYDVDLPSGSGFGSASRFFAQGCP